MAKPIKNPIVTARYLRPIHKGQAHIISVKINDVDTEQEAVFALGVRFPLAPRMLLECRKKGTKTYRILRWYKSGEPSKGWHPPHAPRAMTRTR